MKLCLDARERVVHAHSVEVEAPIAGCLIGGEKSVEMFLGESFAVWVSNLRGK